jgi:hypothetical protein
MLKELVMSLDTQAFKKCGLFPIDREQVLEHIPAAVQTEEIAQHVMRCAGLGTARRSSQGGRRSLLVRTQ